MLTKALILMHRHKQAGSNKSMLTDQFDEMCNLALVGLDGAWHDEKDGLPTENGWYLVHWNFHGQDRLKVRWFVAKISQWVMKPTDESFPSRWAKIAALPPLPSPPQVSQEGE